MKVTAPSQYHRFLDLSHLARILDLEVQGGTLQGKNRALRLKRFMWKTTISHVHQPPLVSLCVLWWLKTRSVCFQLAVRTSPTVAAAAASG